jgi:hypothetical protein
MFLDLSFWKGDMFYLSLDLCRFYFGDYVMSFIFLDLCLVDGVVVLKDNFEYIEMEENTMCFDEAQDATVVIRIWTRGLKFAQFSKCSECDENGAIASVSFS